LWVVHASQKSADCQRAWDWRLLLFVLTSCLAPFVLPLKFLVMRQTPFDFTAATSKHAIEICGCNSTAEAVEATLEVEMVGLDGRSEKQTSEVILAANSSTELTSFLLEKLANRTVVFARLINNEMVLARASDWPQP
jgi:hypothetical protein